jgi:hypothetical protein
MSAGFAQQSKKCPVTTARATRLRTNVNDHDKAVPIAVSGKQFYAAISYTK